MMMRQTPKIKSTPKVDRFLIRFVGLWFAAFGACWLVFEWFTRALGRAWDKALMGEME